MEASIMYLAQETIMKDGYHLDLARNISGRIGRRYLMPREKTCMA